MQLIEVGTVRRLKRCVLFAALMVTVLGAYACPNRLVNRGLGELLVFLPTTEWGSIDVRDYPFLRVHWYPTSIQEGDVVEPFTLDSGAGTPNQQVCQSESGCLLFFVDTNHDAHFAHETVVALWRIDTKSFQTPVLGQWWPLLNGKPLFDTVRAREDWKDELDPDPVTSIVFPRDFPRDYIPEFRNVDPLGFRVRSTTSHRPTPFGLGSDVGEPEDCSKWAVIVNGYHDPEDTFHIDTGGMYTLLRGHGIPDNQINYLCPNPDNTEGCDIQVDQDNLRDVLVNMGSDFGEGALADSACQEFILFYSAHGGFENLYCGNCDECPPLAYATLEGWLDEVHCAKVTVVVEACKSGGLINTLMGSSPTGQTRYVFTSTSDSEESYRDIDKIGEVEDKNPGDIGSETVWGYVESVAAGSSDEDGDNVVSFSEAAKYATDKDITTKIGNVPQQSAGGGPVTAVPSCADQSVVGELEVSLTQIGLVDPADVGQILRCRCNHLEAVVTGVPAGGPINPPPVATARFFWTDTPWTDTSVPKWRASDNENEYGDFKQIEDSTRLMAMDGASQSIKLDWEVGTGIEPGMHITLLALVDSPSSPIADSPSSPIADTEIGIDVLEEGNWASALKLEVINPSSCFLFPCKGGNRRCEP